MAVLETPSSRKRQMSSSLPLSRETPSEPFGRPSFRPEDLAGLGEALAGALANGEERRGNLGQRDTDAEETGFSSTSSNASRRGPGTARGR